MTRDRITIPVTVLQRRGLNATGKLLYGLLRDYQGSNEAAWPGQRRLADDLGVHHGTIVKALRDLESAGLIEIETGGGRRSNRYRVNPPPASDRETRAQTSTESGSLCAGNPTTSDRETRTQDQALRSGIAPPSVRETRAPACGKPAQNLSQQPIPLNKTARAGSKAKTQNGADGQQPLIDVGASKPKSKRNGTSGNGKASSAHRQLVVHFCDAWQAKFGAKYPFARGKDAARVTAILGAVDQDVDRAKRIVDAYLADPDSWLSEQGHSLAVMASSARLPKYVASTVSHDGNGHAEAFEHSVIRLAQERFPDDLESQRPDYMRIAEMIDGEHLAVADFKRHLSNSQTGPEFRAAILDDVREVACG